MVSQLTTALGPSQVVDLSPVSGLIRSAFSQATNQTSLAGFERTATVMALVTRAATNPQGKSGLTGWNLDDDEAGMDVSDFKEFSQDNGKGGSTPPSSPNGLFIDGAAVSQYLTSQMGAQVTLEKLATAAGFQNLDAAIKGIQQGLASGSLKMPSATEFSDIAAVWNLPQAVTSVPTLINAYWASSYYVKGLSTGLNQSGMNSALKVGYAQAYRRLSATSGQ
jgi:hypothetical protein